MPSASASAPRWPVRGTATVEMALLVPVFLLFLGGAVDFGFAYLQLARLQAAAQIGAQTAADVMTGAPLSGGLSAAAVAAGGQAARDALPDIPPGRLVVTVAWDDAEQISVRPAPEGVLTVALPDLADGQTVLDFRHSHTGSYLQPTFGWANWGASYQPGISYLDLTPAVETRSYQSGGPHNYFDQWNQPIMGRPEGGLWGIAFPIFGIAYGSWWGFSDVASGQTTSQLGRVMPAAPTAGSVQQALPPTDVWRRAWLDPFFLNDEITTQTGRQAIGFVTSTDGSLVTVGPYVSLRGMVQRQIPSEPATVTVHQRLVRVTVQMPLQPVTPILSGILANRQLRGSALAATSTITQ